MKKAMGIYCLKFQQQKMGFSYWWLFIIRIFLQLFQQIDKNIILFPYIQATCKAFQINSATMFLQTHLRNTQLFLQEHLHLKKGMFQNIKQRIKFSSSHFGLGDLSKNTLRPSRISLGQLQLCSKIEIIQLNVIGKQKCGLFGSEMFAVQKILQYYFKMSMIIEQIMFSRGGRAQERVAKVYEDGLNLNKIMKTTQDSIFIKQNQFQSHFINKIKLQHEEYMVELKINKQIPFIRCSSVLIHGYSLKKINSIHNQIAVMQQINQRIKETHAEWSFYLQQGRIYMIVSFLFIVAGNWLSRWTQLYHKIITKNLVIFQEFLTNTLRVTKKADTLEAPFSDSKQTLLLGRILNNINTNSGLSESKTRHQAVNASFKQQAQQLSSIISAVIINQTMQKSTRHIYTNYPKHLDSLELQGTLLQSYQLRNKKIKSFLELKYPLNKNMEDYLFNSVKVEVVEDIIKNRPIGDGGSSLVHICKVKMNFIGSIDFQRELPLLEKVDKVVAVKIAKLQPGKIEKIAHQNKVVSKLKSSCSYFLPKYYGVMDKTSKFYQTVMMQYLQGEQLGQYIINHCQTMSFLSKLYILLNVVHGMMDLANLGISHLDIKPNNIILCKSFIPKIIDFGQAYHPSVCPKNYTPTSFTFPYVAPELYLRYMRQKYKKEDSLEYSEKQDIFSFGIMMSEIFFDTRVFTLSDAGIRDSYARRTYPSLIYFVPERAQAYGEEFYLQTIAFLILRCLQPDPKLRPRLEWIGIILKTILTVIS